METVTWPVQQQFYFPEQFGVAHRVKDFTVTPIWEKVKKKESFRLTGIYRITANILFQKGQCASEGILIDDLDENDDAHYFEYGSPLEIDLPLRTYESIELQVKDDNASVQSNGTVIVSFTVECNLSVNEPDEHQIIEQPISEQKGEEMKQPISEQKSEEMKPANLQKAEEMNEPTKKQEEMHQPASEKKPKETKKRETMNKVNEEMMNESSSVEKEKGNVALLVQEIEQPEQHEFSFLHQLKDEYSLFSLSPQMKSDHNK